MRVASAAPMPHLPGARQAAHESLRSRVRGALRTLGRLAFGDYGLYRIYSVDLLRAAEPPSTKWTMAQVVDPQEFARSTDSALRDLATYTGTEAYAFGVWTDGRLVAGCWFWSGETYRCRNFWPLSPGDAKLVQITTAEEFRGRGIAPTLISFATDQMRARGYKRLFARIWHSHAASLATFRKAGWKEEAFVTEVFPFQARRSFRFVRRRSPR